jgi:hypothetical protein
MTVTAERETTAAAAAGVEGNARLTGLAATLLLVALAVEGVTILRVRQLLSVHVFVGMVVGALILLKLGSTGYRFARYYTGRPAYVERGAPHPVLRLTGPFVVLTSIAVVVTGIILIASGRGARDPWLGLHKASFFVWIALMAVHVVGHLRETARLTASELGPQQAPAVPGRAARLALAAVTIAVGSAAGVAALSWVSEWHVRG